MAVFNWNNISPVGAAVSAETEKISINPTVDGPDTFTSGSARMLINGVEVTPKITETAADDWTLEYTPNKGDMWFGTTYTVRVEIKSSDNDTGRHAWTFTTVSGVSKRVVGYQRAHTTQILGNSFPDWARARQSPASVAQQLLNTIALKMEDARDELSRLGKNRFAQTADRNDMDLLYRHEFGEAFDFTKRFFHNGDFEFIAPTLTGIEGVAAIPVSVLDDLYTFWNLATPDRISSASAEFLYMDGLVMSYTPLSHSPLTHDFHVQVPGHLYIEAFGGDNYLSIRDESVSFTQIKLKGIGRHGQEQEELMVLERPCIKRTQKEWKKITKVWMTGGEFNPLAEIAIWNFEPINSEKTDLLEQVVTKNREVYPSHWQLGSNSHGSLLQQSAFVGSGILEMIRTPTLVPHREYELLNVAGSNITLQDFCLDRCRRFLYGVDSSKLYIFDKRPEYYDNFGTLRSRTDDPVMEIQFRVTDLSRSNAAGGLTLGVRRAYRAPHTPVARFRWSVILPDGTTRYIDHLGTMHLLPVPFEEVKHKDSFVVSDALLTVDLGLAGQATPRHGSYIFVLEYERTDGVSEKVMEVFHVDYLQAIAEYNLDLLFARTPPQPLAPLQDAQVLADAVLTKATSRFRIVMDSDDRLRVIRDSMMYLVDDRYDTAVIDFDSKEAFFRENFDSVRVS